MTAKQIILMALIVVSFTACKKSSDNSLPAELDTANAGLTSSFDSLNMDMASNATEIAQNINDTAAIRAKMLGLFNRSSFVVEFSYVNPQGIMQIIEPALYHSTQGADISQQSHIIKAFQTKQPVLSDMFYAVEHFYAAVDIHPMVNNWQVLGGIASLFLPQTILGRIITPLVKNQPFEMWVMDNDGNILYDQDTEEIGRNLFTDALYTPYPELITAGHKIAAEKSGETSYSFFQTGTTKVVVKKTYWITYELYGTEWKIIWVKPE
jgi:hypothetical protein